MKIDSKKSVIFLDGGFGTTLEDVFSKNISNTPLWSADIIATDPDAIVAAHIAFLEAGARVLLTSTYQCSYETFERAGYSFKDASSFMKKAVELAVKTKTRFIGDRTDLKFDDIKIALSLGPYGAALPFAQEFTGYYPPPYGPQEFSENVENRTVFSEEEKALNLELNAIIALEEFHFKRLAIFFEDTDIWNSIDIIAFETVPLVREIKAIRTAMGRVNEQLGADGANTEIVGQRTPFWWISTVWPNGKFPEESNVKDKKLKPKDIINSVICHASASNPMPNSIGINCTKIDHLPSILHEFKLALRASFEYTSLSEKLWLTIYPNGGINYNADTRSWDSADDEDKDKSGLWARCLADIVRTEEKDEMWAGIIVGGCCKTSPEYIRALRKELLHEV